MSSERKRRRWPWILGAVIVVLFVPVAILVIPILAHQNAGISNQQQSTQDWPVEVTAEGDDGRTRVLSVLAEDGSVVDTSALEVGQRLVVSGTGYDAARGIYVAICVIPDDPSIKPGPCIGGVPAQEATEVAEGTIQYAASNWINDDWAWKLFGARGYDDVATGSFTAYIEVGDPAGDGFDCRVDACGITTRNDHTALGDRVQDVHIPVAFAD